MLVQLAPSRFTSRMPSGSPAHTHSRTNRDHAIITFKFSSVIFYKLRPMDSKMGIFRLVHELEHGACHRATEMPPPMYIVRVAYIRLHAIFLAAYYLYDGSEWHFNRGSFLVNAKCWHKVFAEAVPCQRCLSRCRVLKSMGIDRDCISHYLFSFNCLDLTLTAAPL